MCLVNDVLLSHGDGRPWLRYYKQLESSDIS
jgi:hypothetical protein